MARYELFSEWRLGQSVAVVIDGKRIIREVYLYGGKEYILYKNKKYYKNQFVGKVNNNGNSKK